MRIHYDLDTVLKEAEDSWNNFHMGKMPDNSGKCAHLLGILKSRYQRIFEDLPDNRKFILKDNYKQSIKS